jgi:hypothetical protein
MVAHLLGEIAILLVDAHVFKGFVLKLFSAYKLDKKAPRKRTSIGLNGLAIRPIVDE